MSELKYYYLFDKNGVLTHIDKAIKGETYYYEHSKIEFIVRDGDINRKHFALKNTINFLSFGGGGESIEHYNAKMKIANELTYFDDIFDTDIYFHKVISEKKINNKIPDLSCYDENDNLVMAIEIFYSNKKTEIDILELKKLGIPIVEIDINNDNKCKHLVLPTLLEANRQKLRNIKELFSESANRFKERIAESKREYRKYAEEHSPDINNLREAIFLYEKAIQNNGSKRVQKINDWLQKRIINSKPIDSGGETISTLQERIRDFKQINESIKNETFKTDYRIGKVESDINRIESEIKQRRNDISKIAESCKVEWLRPKFMKNSPIINKINELKYWSS